MNQPEQTAFYQGQLDVFCAAYAVLNALRFLHGIRPLEARRLLHEALCDVARDPEIFQAVLDQRTDYITWVDAMLERQIRQGGLCAEAPFAAAPRPALCAESSAPSPRPDVPVVPSPDADTIWHTLADWLAGGADRCALFQFIRFPPVGRGSIRHWTCCAGVEGRELVLYDCSREPGALTRIARGRLIADETARAPETVLVPPHTIRLVWTRLARGCRETAHRPYERVSRREDRRALGVMRKNAGGNQ